MKAQPGGSSDADRCVLAGELTIYTVGEHLSRLRAHLAGRAVCELDLSAVSEIDGAGLQLLLWLREAARARGIAVRVIGLGAAVGEVFELLQLGASFGLDAASAAGGMA